MRTPPHGIRQSCGVTRRLIDDVAPLLLLLVLVTL
jgi:hypothetical protein